MAAGTMTFTYESAGPVYVCNVSWVTSTDTGAVSGSTAKLEGRLVKAITIPSGTAAPADNYDIVLTDSNSFNFLSNCDDNLLDRDIANTEEVYFFVKNAAAVALAVHPMISSVVTVAVTNAGNSTAGTIKLFLQRA